jgi:hypothetical protein
MRGVPVHQSPPSEEWPFETPSWNAFQEGRKRFEAVLAAQFEIARLERAFSAPALGQSDPSTFFNEPKAVGKTLRSTPAPAAIRQSSDAREPLASNEAPRTNPPPE